MTKTLLLAFGELLILCSSGLGADGASAVGSAVERPATMVEAKVPEVARPQLLRRYGNLPLSFEVNQGQSDSRVKFLSHAGGSSLHLTQTEAILSLRRNPTSKERARGKPWDVRTRAPEHRDVVRMKLIGANPAPRIEGVSELPGRSNYFIGNDPKKWRTNIANYARVEYRDVYPGVNLAYYGNQRQLEYDLIVAPGADPRVIRLAFEGVQKMRLDEHGNLVLRTEGGEILQHKPIVYQEVDGTKKEISGSYVIGRKNQVGFQIAEYDPSKPLMIDPVLSYSTYLGGSALGGVWEIGHGIAVDSSGNAYVTGDAIDSGVWVIKLNPAGSALVYSTLLSSLDLGSNARGVAVDSAGNAYVTGVAVPGFPTTPGAFQPTAPGPAAFVTKLNAAGDALLYSTYLGVFNTDASFLSITGSIAVDSAGNAYVTGVAAPGFPTTPGAFQPTAPNGANDAPFVAKLNAAGSALVYSTYFGSTYILGIAADSAGNAYVTGIADSSLPTTPGAFQPIEPDGADSPYISKLNPTGSALVYSTYLGNADDVASGVALDSAGNAYVTGVAGPGFPTTSGAFQPTYVGPVSSFDGDAFVTKLNAAGSALVYSTYLGAGFYRPYTFGSPLIAVDAAGHAYVTGATYSTDFPTLNAFQAALARGASDPFITKLNSAGSALVYSSYLGGNEECGESGLAVAVDGSGSAYLTGFTDAYNFPITTGPTKPHCCGCAAYDPFVSKVSAADAATAAAGQSVTVSTVPGVAGDAGISATLTNNEGGTPTVTAESFPSDPGTANIIDLGGRYVDLKVTGATLADSVTAQFYYPSTVTGSAETNLRLFYFTGSQWQPVASSGNTSPVKDTTNNLAGTVSGGQFTVVFDATSTPKITELTGTVFTSSVAVSYSVCLLYDPTKPNKSGSTVPIKFQLCDPAVGNLSSADVVVTALLVVRVSSNAPGVLQDPGNANPDSNFRYDSTLGGTGGYIYNLGTKGFATGTYALTFKAGADKLTHSVQFEVK